MAAPDGKLPIPVASGASQNDATKCTNILEDEKRQSLQHQNVSTSKSRELSPIDDQNEFPNTAQEQTSKKKLDDKAQCPSEGSEDRTKQTGFENQGADTEVGGSKVKAKGKQSDMIADRLRHRPKRKSTEISRVNYAIDLEQNDETFKEQKLTRRKSRPPKRILRQVDEDYVVEDEAEDSDVPVKKKSKKRPKTIRALGLLPNENANKEPKKKGRKPKKVKSNMENSEKDQPVNPKPVKDKEGSKEQKTKKDKPRKKRVSKYDIYNDQQENKLSDKSMDKFSAPVGLLKDVSNMSENWKQIWCFSCRKLYKHECSEHGPLNIIPDKRQLKAYATLPRNVTIRNISSKKKSKYTDDGSVEIIGVHAVRKIEKGHRFGPLEGKYVTFPKDFSLNDSKWLVFREAAMPLCMETGDVEVCNWMMFVRKTEEIEKQNLVAFQFLSNIYFVTTKDIKEGEELRYYYSDNYFELLETALPKTMRENNPPPWELRGEPARGCDIQVQGISNNTEGEKTQPESSASSEQPADKETIPENAKAETDPQNKAATQTAETIPNAETVHKMSEKNSKETTYEVNLQNTPSVQEKHTAPNSKTVPVATSSVETDIVQQAFDSATSGLGDQDNDLNSEGILVSSTSEGSNLHSQPYQNYQQTVTKTATAVQSQPTALPQTNTLHQQSGSVSQQMTVVPVGAAENQHPSSVHNSSQNNQIMPSSVHNSSQTNQIMPSQMITVQGGQTLSSQNSAMEVSYPVTNAITPVSLVENVTYDANAQQNGFARHDQFVRSMEMDYPPNRTVTDNAMTTLRANNYEVNAVDIALHYLQSLSDSPAPQRQDGTQLGVVPQVVSQFSQSIYQQNTMPMGQFTFPTVQTYTTSAIPFGNQFQTGDMTQGGMRHIADQNQMPQLQLGQLQTADHQYTSLAPMISQIHGTTTIDETPLQFSQNTPQNIQIAPQLQAPNPTQCVHNILNQDQMQSLSAEIQLQPQNIITQVAPQLPQQITQQLAQPPAPSQKASRRRVSRITVPEGTTAVQRGIDEADKEVESSEEEEDTDLEIVTLTAISKNGAKEEVGDDTPVICYSKIETANICASYMMANGLNILLLCIKPKDELQKHKNKKKYDMPMQLEQPKGPFTLLSDGRQVKEEQTVVLPELISSPSKDHPSEGYTYRYILPPGWKSSHICTKCGRVFRMLSMLRKHWLSHSSKRTHLCDVCGQGFKSFACMKRHYEIHSESREIKFFCAKCGKGFFDQYKCRRHEMIHTGEHFKHKCPVCDKVFSSSTHLKRHRLIHDGVKPFSCPVCDRRFTQKSDMQKHASLHKKF